MKTASLHPIDLRTLRATGCTSDGVARPAVLCVRGPSRSGKTTVCELLIAFFEARGRRTAYLKRTHHELDLPEKASGRVWTRGPSAMVILTPDRMQVTTPHVEPTAAAMLMALPAGIDVALLETHSAENYPTILSTTIEPAAGEDVISRWCLDTLDRDIKAITAAALEAVCADGVDMTYAKEVCP